MVDCFRMFCLRVGVFGEGEWVIGDFGDFV